MNIRKYISATGKSLSLGLIAFALSVWYGHFTHGDDIVFLIQGLSFILILIFGTTLPVGFWLTVLSFIVQEIVYIPENNSYGNALPFFEVILMQYPLVIALILAFRPRR